MSISMVLIECSNDDIYSIFQKGNFNIVCYKLQTAIINNYVDKLLSLLKNIYINNTYINYDIYILKIHSNINKLYFDKNNNICNLININFTYNNIQLVKKFIQLLRNIRHNGNLIKFNYKLYIYNIHTKTIDSSITHRYYKSSTKQILLHLLYNDSSDQAYLHFINSIESIEITVYNQWEPVECGITITSIPPLIISIDNECMFSYDN